MLVNAIKMKNFIDNLSDEDLKGKIENLAIHKPGYFFSVLSIRSIGKRRMEKIQKLAFKMCLNADKNTDTYLVGMFVIRVIEEALKEE